MGYGVKDLHRFLKLAVINFYIALNAREADPKGPLVTFLLNSATRVLLPTTFDLKNDLDLENDLDRDCDLDPRYAVKRNLTYDLDLKSQAKLGQGQPQCQISRS